MIRISRSQCPRCLAQPGASYRELEVATTLFQMQHKKCCYCESDISRNGQGRGVEHFRPRSSFPALENEWTNLLLDCAQCNGSKGRLFPFADGRPLLIDPSDPDDDDPETQIGFIVDDSSPLRGVVVARDESVRGRTTIETTGIGRAFFVMRRRERLNRLTRDYVDCLEALDREDWEWAERCLDRIRSALKASSEYSALAREYFRSRISLVEEGIRRRSAR